jgi:cytochrome P450 PksS
MRPIPAIPALSDEALIDLHPMLHRLRQDDPVHWSEEHRAWVLTRYDDVLSAFRDARLPAVVEESLRYDGAVPFTHRLALERLTIRGKTIDKGQLVFLGIAAATRDPAIFADPDRFDITRENASRHIAFGYGPHGCLGAGLARQELSIALGTLLRRMPAQRLDPQNPPARRYESLTFRGFSSLPVVFG